MMALNLEQASDWILLTAEATFPGADPGFLEGGGSNSSRGGSFSAFYLIVRKFPHVIFQMCPCHLCDRDYCWRSSPEKHLRSYHGEPQFSCPLCPRIFRHKASLEQHSFSKHNPGACSKSLCAICVAKTI